MPGAASATEYCLMAGRAHRLFILQSYVFLGAKPNYPAIFALNMRHAALLCHQYGSTPGTAEKVFHGSAFSVLRNNLIFKALQKAMF